MCRFLHPVGKYAQDIIPVFYAKPLIDVFDVINSDPQDIPLFVHFLQLLHLLFKRFLPKQVADIIRRLSGSDLIDTAEQKRLFLFPEHINASFAVFSDPAVFDIMRLFFPAQHLL